MVFSFVSSASNSVLGLTFNIFFDTDFNEYQVRSSVGTVLFKAESEALAMYGVRTYHSADYCGSKLTEGCVQ
tara:strand:+ start:274 stop:489 length:216 start_codon:yes stop_codon:yes gene_type:complete